jgi:SpoIID/LytB domain protein
LGVALAITPLAVGPAQAAPDTGITALNGTITITSVGWGHGRGMSQYGAQMAAKAGYNYQQILAFYYPGTTFSSIKSNDVMRVWIRSDNDGYLNVKPATGLKIKDNKGHAKTLPTGTKYKQWRIKISSSKRALQYKNASGKWVTYKTNLNAKSVWSFYNTTSGKVTAVLPGSVTRAYKGKLALRVQGGQKITVNTVKTEDYLKSVVPSEVPASWNAEALKAQTVAARSYAVRYRANLKSKKAYDICDTSACQAYKGASNEASATNAAVAATAGQVLTYQGHVAWTEFTSSNGGYSAAGDHDYLVAQEDPFDLAANQVWAIPLTTAQIQKAYPAIGTFQSMSLERDGKGQFGGRVTKVTLVGSKGTKTVTGTSFKSTFSLRETMFQATAGLSTSSGTYKAWQKLGGSRGTLGIPTASEVAVKSGFDAESGLVAQFANGWLFYSPDTGTQLLTGGLLSKYISEGGAGGPLGYPVTGIEYPTTNLWSFSPSMQAAFEFGLIGCPVTVTDPATQCVTSFG